MLINISDKHKCCGCGACLFICPRQCIAMEKDALGFEYPVIDAKQCIDCGKCDDVCPFINFDTLVNGHSVEWLGLRHLDKQTLKASSSGGAFTAIVQAYENAIGAKSVVYGAAWDSVFQVKHKRVSKDDEFDSIRKSKYIQSKISSVFSMLREDIDAGIPVVFSGTPCQTAAIKSLCNGENKENLLTIEIICKGVASSTVFAGWIDWLQRGNRIVESVDFRSRKKAEKPSVLRVKFNKGKDYVRAFNTYDDPFTDAYLKGLISRECCSVCPFSGMFRSADFTIGDYWGGLKDSGMLFEKENGTSIVICNNEKAERIARKFSNQAVVFSAEKNVAINGNSSLTRYPGESADRANYLKCFQEEGFDAARKIYATPRSWLMRLASNIISDSLKQKIKSGGSKGA